MSYTYILILVFSNAFGSSMQNMEFRSKEACEAAAIVSRESLRQLPTGQIVSTKNVIAQCVAK